MSTGILGRRILDAVIQQEECFNRQCDFLVKLVTLNFIRKVAQSRFEDFIDNVNSFLGQSFDIVVVDLI